MTEARVEQVLAEEDLRYCEPLMLVGGCLTVLLGMTMLILMSRVPATPQNAEWRSWVIGLWLVYLPFGCATIVVFLRPSSHSFRFKRGYIDALLLLVYLGGALLSANAQRQGRPFYPGMATILCCQVVRTRRLVHFIGICVTVATIAISVFAFDPLAFSRATATIILVFTLVVALTSASASIESRRREVRGRLALEDLRGELQQRIDAQVGEIRVQAKEVATLNEQLRDQVRARSRELTVALSSLMHQREPRQLLTIDEVLAGRFKVTKWIGAGGMGSVYEGVDTLTGSTVALKAMQASSAQQLDAMRRFLAEAQLLAHVTHAAIVKPLFVDCTSDGRLFQALELVRGVTVAKLVETGGALPASTVRALAAVLGSALRAAHERDIVHRDVKPDNVMLTDAAPGAKLLDFGISKLHATGADEITPQTQTGIIIGTPAFMAPEQIEGGVCTPASDVYSLGLVLYVAAAGAHPFRARTPVEWHLAHTQGAPPPLRIDDQDLADAVLACLAKSPEARPVAGELAALAPADATRQLAASPVLRALLAKVDAETKSRALGLP